MSETRIITRNGVGEPAAEAVLTSELALDHVTGDLYTKLQSGIIKKINSADLSDAKPVIIAVDPPSDPAEGDLWFCSHYDVDGLFCLSLIHI